MTNEERGLLGDLEIRQIVQLVEALDRSNLDTLQLDLGHFRLTLGKAGTSTESSSPLQKKSGRPTAASPAPSPQPTAKPTAAFARSKGAPGTIDVLSPIMGIFYSKPDPGSPPFVSLGAKVDEGTTVGLIEVMKVFNAVQAGAHGEIAEICVKDAETVEINQILFRIRPAKA